MKIGIEELTVDHIWQWLDNPDPVELAETTVSRIVACFEESTASSEVAYGRATGVGANRDVLADDADGDHGARLLRSHVAGGGEDLGDEVARAMMLVRLNQLSRPGSGISPSIVQALAQVVNDGRTPLVRKHGAVGTGEITVFGELALCMSGELPWRDGSIHDYGVRFSANDALAFMSSSAVTIANASLALREAEIIAKSSLVIAALSVVPVRANPQHWSEVAAQVRPSPGVSISAEAMRRLVGDSLYVPARTQDPFGWRAIPYVHGPFLDSIASLRKELQVCLNSGIENPRFANGQVWHHGAFHLTSLALRLDHLRLALVQWLTLSLSRMVKLNDPYYTGLTRFLAEGPSGSSGVMVLEYTAGSALETVRQCADPVSRHTINISLGAEDHAPFATQSVFATHGAVQAARTVLACELVTAMRAIRKVQTGPSIAAVAEACSALSSETADRALIADIECAERLLNDLADFFTQV